MKRAIFIAAAAAALAGQALAQDGAADRAEMDLAAGRVLFQNTPLSVSIVEVRTADVTPPTSTPVQARRKPLRVVLPSPYVR